MAIRIDKERDDMPWMIGMLAKMMILLFDSGRIDMLEDVGIDKAVMIFG